VHCGRCESCVAANFHHISALHIAEQYSASPKITKEIADHASHTDGSEIVLETIEAKDVGAWNRLVGIKIYDSGEVIGGFDGDLKDDVIRVCDFKFEEKVFGIVNDEIIFCFVTRCYLNIFNGVIQGQINIWPISYLIFL